VSEPRRAGPSGLTCVAVQGVGEVVAGDDLAGLLAAAVELRDGDVLVVTSKVVSKAEGRVRTGKREEALGEETDRVVATRGRTSIVRTHHGLVMAAAGIDASNTDADTVVLLPSDPDGSARRLRETLARSPGCNVAVLVTDTAGRAWRNGQTDIAIGAAGLEVMHDYAGVTDPYGNELAVTAPAVADEVAAVADLVKGKLDRRPAAVVRGLEALVLPVGDHGPGAAALVRDEAHDMFGLGAREAVLTALGADDSRGFGAPSTALELVDALSALAGGSVSLVVGSAEVTATLRGDEWERGRADTVLRTAAFAMGWRAVPEDDPAGKSTFLRLLPATP
jgi:coenzyme F420-0:L-glutamate ligase/coenzyme F420-1:gamma-L-glutamate ligase